jgi:superfamily II DNA or RNA helicase
MQTKNESESEVIPMPLSYQTLLSFAGSGVYRLGAEYCRGGRVTLGERGEEGAITASVRGGSGNLYRVEVQLSAQGSDLESCRCDCPAFARDHFCKHVVATLLEFQSDAASLGGAADRLISPLVTAPEARELLRRSARRIADRVSLGREGEAALEATLELTSFGVGVSFRVGGGRFYVVRDLARFRQRFAQGETETYGQQLTLWHNPASFQKESRPLLDFFLNRLGSPRAYGPGNGRALEMDLEQLEELLALHEGKTLPVRVGGTERVTLVRREDYRPALSLRGEEDLCRLSTQERFRVLKGANTVAVLAGERIYLCGRAFSAACGDLLETLTQNSGSLTFARRDLGALHATILAEAGPYLSMELDEELAAFSPPPLRTRIYLDYQAPDRVTARMTFTYGDRTHGAFREKDLRESLDLAAEMRAQDALARYFPGQPDGGGLLVIDGNPDALYHLAGRGIRELSQLAELYLSDNMEKLKLHPPGMVRVGARLSGGLLDLEFDLEGLDLSELAGILASYRQTRRYHRLKDGSFLSLEEGGLLRLAEMAMGLGLHDRDLAAGHVQVESFRALYLDAVLRQDDHIRYDREAGFASLVRAMEEPPKDEPVPESLSSVLRGYQKTGYRWLKTLRRYGFGGILADDMGLGKTIQVLALLEAYREEVDGKRLPSLVVCPASLTLNWESEVQRFTPSLRAKALVGAAPEREEILSHAGDYDLLITSYDQIKRDIDAYGGLTFAFIVADEAQYIKNRDTQNAQTVKRLQGETRLALTGTPVENSLAELWSIFDFLMPGYLFPYPRFRTRYELPIVRGADGNAAESLRRLVRPFLLRRLKREVLPELPPKTETILKAAMEPEQRKLYLATLARTRLDLEAALSRHGAGQGRLMILAALTRLRQICCDPSLLYEEYHGGSVKLDACLELVESCIASGHRLLLFSQFTSMLDIVEARLDTMGIASYKLVGATKTSERQQLVGDFNQGDVPVFLISLKAGGTGLNLTGADVVIHYDPWWNAGAQNQATDRAHRIGQTSNVQVYKLIARDTVEEKILRLQEEKIALAEQILQGGGNVLEALSREELLSLLEE